MGETSSHKHTEQPTKKSSSRMCPERKTVPGLRYSLLLNGNAPCPRAACKEMTLPVTVRERLSCRPPGEELQKISFGTRRTGGENEPTAKSSNLQHSGSSKPVLQAVDETSPHFPRALIATVQRCGGHDAAHVPRAFSHGPGQPPRLPLF